MSAARADAEDSGAEHARLRGLIEKAESRLNETDKRCELHRLSSEHRDQWQKEVDRDLAKIKFLGVLALAAWGTLAVAGSWIVKSAVRDALVDHGVLRLAPKATALEQ
jgi:hypothetical protein